MGICGSIVQPGLIAPITRDPLGTAYLYRKAPVPVGSNMVLSKGAPDRSVW